MLAKTTFDFNDPIDKAREARNKALKQQEHAAQTFQQRKFSKPLLGPNDLSEILYKLMVSPTKKDLEMPSVLKNLRNREWPQVAENINHSLVNFFANRPMCKMRVSTSDILPFKVFQDACEALTEEVDRCFPEKLSDDTQQTAALCRMIVKNISEKIRLFEGGRLAPWQKRYLKAVSPVNKIYTEGKNPVKRLNELLAHTTVDDPFSLSPEVNLMPLKRKAKERSVIFLNELPARVKNGSGDNFQNFFQGASNNFNFLPVVTIAGMVVLNERQNLMTPIYSLTYPGDKHLGKWVCVDQREQSSHGRIRVAPYLGNPNQRHHNLHYTHCENTRHKSEHIKRLEKRFSEKNCCGYVLEKRGNIVGVEFFDNPNDFKAVSKHFAEFLFGTCCFESNTKQPFKINSEKNMKILPGKKSKEWGFLKDHSLKHLASDGYAIKSFAELELESGDNPIHMSIKW